MLVTTTIELQHLLNLYHFTVNILDFCGNGNSKKTYTGLTLGIFDNRELHSFLSFLFLHYTSLFLVVKPLLDHSLKISNLEWILGNLTILDNVDNLSIPNHHTSVIRNLYDSNIPLANTLTLNALGANIFVTNASSNISRYAPIELIGSIGRIDILSQGAGYKVGDKLSFTPIPGYTLGYGAAGAVTEVDASGGIHKVELQPFSYSSNANYSVSVTTSSAIVTGNNTNFLVDFKTGYNIIIFNQTRTISSIASNTSMTVSSPFTVTKSNTEIGLYDLYPIGGLGYSQDYLPAVSVISSTGTGAVLKATSIMGSGEILLPYGTYREGEIKTISITDPGVGYKATPIVDLSGSGSGTATAYAEILSSYYQYPGKYTDTGGQLSSDKRIQDSAFYNTGSYLLKTKQQFSKYKSALLKMLHPAGSVAYAEYAPTEKSIPIGTSLTSSSTEQSIVTGKQIGRAHV